MKKLIAIILAILLVMAMSVHAFAVTPKWEYKAVKLPQIKPDTSFVQGAVSKWFKEHPFELPNFKISFTSPVLN